MLCCVLGDLQLPGSFGHALLQCSAMLLKLGLRLLQGGDVLGDGRHRNGIAAIVGQS